MDAWQLGVTIYKIWCHELPFSASFPRGRMLDVLAAVTAGSDATLNLVPKRTDFMPTELLDLIVQFFRCDPAARHLDRPLCLIQQCFFL